MSDGIPIDIDYSRELLFTDVDECEREYEYLVDNFDMGKLKNGVWQMIHHIVKSDDTDVFWLTDISNLEVWFTPARGSNSKSAGGICYTRDGMVEHAELIISLRALARTYQTGSSLMKMLEGVIKHELCHLHVFQEYGDHGEYDDVFQKTLEQANAPSFFNWPRAEHVYKYR